MKLKKFLVLFCFAAMTILPSFAISEGFQPVDDDYIDNATTRSYKKITKDERIINALEAMRGGLSDNSREAILGNNLTGKPMKVEFRNLSLLNPKYTDFDALGWKNKGQLYIYVNEKHQNAPKEALAALLSHEALHQDEINSLNEEAYC